MQVCVSANFVNLLKAIEQFKTRTIDCVNLHINLQMQKLTESNKIEIAHKSACLPAHKSGQFKSHCTNLQVLWEYLIDQFKI